MKLLGHWLNETFRKFLNETFLMRLCGSSYETILMRFCGSHFIKINKCLIIIILIKIIFTKFIVIFILNTKNFVTAVNNF